MLCYKAVLIKHGQSAQDPSAETKTISFQVSCHKKANGNAIVLAFDEGMALVSTWCCDL
jgi:hypothetical protein